MKKKDFFLTFLSLVAFQMRRNSGLWAPLLATPTIVTSIQFVILTLFVPGFASPLSYFDIALKLNKSFALMHPDFKSNLVTHIFKNFGVSRIIGSNVIFAFVRGT